MTVDRSHLLQLLGVIYGDEDSPAILARIENLLAVRSARLPAVEPRGLNEADVLLITYPDQVQAAGESPLSTLAHLADEYAAGLVNTIHLLPFFPSSSDDGFAVTDYEAVDPAYGTWGDIEHLGQRFGLMFDAVINHASVQGGWFQEFLREDKAFADFFIEILGKPDLTAVVRPRTTPLLTDFASQARIRSIWTTFSADQADLNYRNPEVLLRILDALLFYVERGARFVRLDAVGYIWKEVGTACIHLPQAHAIVSLLRSAMQIAAPQTMLLTETNVVQSENLGYLGNGMPEAHLAYNFALPPLLLHTFHTAQSATLTDWAAAFPMLPEGTAMLNVLATHDGIGLNGCRGILAESEIAQLTRRVEAAGGYVSLRTNRNGQADPYELNINYMDALDAAPADTGEELSIRRFISAHAIMLSLRGVPAIYFHSLFGSRGWHPAAGLSARPRSINREKFAYSELRAQLADVNSFRAKVHRQMAALLRARKRYRAFSPFARQDVLRAGNGVFALLRGDDDPGGQVLCIHNVTPQAQTFDWKLWLAGSTRGRVVDIISLRDLDKREDATCTLAPYESFWLRMVDWQEGIEGLSGP